MQGHEHEHVPTAPGRYELPTWAALPARPDPDFDRLAAQVATELAVQRVLVVLVSKAGQVFPGAFGLPEPWASQRSLPLSMSLSRHVVSTGRPLFVDDVLDAGELVDRAIVDQLGVRSHMAVALVDGRGRPIGALAASDDVPRHWTAHEAAVLERWAALCSRLLQTRALELAEQEAAAVAVRDDASARAAAESAREALLLAEAEADRARVVARLSSALLGAGGLGDVLRVADRLVRSPLGAATVALGVAESGSSDVRVWSTSTGSTPLDGPAAVLCLDDAHPLTAALRGRRVVVADPVTGAPPDVAALPGGACASAVAVPLAMGQHASTGALLVCWRQPREIDGPVRAVVTDLAHHLGHALDRVLLREQRDRLRDAPA
ncbi:GAF domain-containing protein [Modestobacter sp. NPDC049651]|uniref:GAF domain-containing protein n=1 Tax=unclassified Modestobacter TaxID=2643866 RepID=UPI0033F233D6